MASPVFQGNVNQVHYDGPGIILMAPYATDLTVPTMTSASSAFTDTWDGAWQPVGYTDDGFELDFGFTTVDIDAAESLQDLATVVTKQTTSIKFSMMQDNTFNMRRAFNGGTYTVTGSAGTQVTKYSPPIAGGELESSIAWLSTKRDEVIVAYRVLQTGNLAFARKKVGTKFVLACDFRVLVPDPTLSTDVWNRWFAGTKYDV